MTPNLLLVKPSWISLRRSIRLRQLYNNTQDPNIKSTINKLQKEIRTKINQESTISWEKFYNSISLESDPKKSLHKITNFLKPKGPHSYPMLNSSCPRAQNMKHLCYSQSKNRLHKKPLYFMTSIVGTGNREG